MLRLTSLLAALCVAFAFGVPRLAWAAVVDGNAVPVKTFSARGGTELSSTGGPLTQSLQGRPTVVLIGADWCSACKATAPTIAAVKKTYAGKINFVEFDLSNAKTAAASQQQAQALGLSKLYEALKSATSSVAVVDSKTGKVYGTLYNDGTLTDYQKLVDQALKGQSA